MELFNPARPPRHRTHKSLLLHWLLLLITTLAAAQVQAANDRGLLLQATKGEHTVYLLGSIHLADQSFYPLRDTIINAYNNSSALVVEADVVAMESDPQLQQKVMLESFYPPGDQLKNHIPPTLYGELQTWLRKRQIPETHFSRMRPAIAMITLSMVEMQARGLDPKAGIDRHFLLQARQKGKTTLELESVIQQLQLLNSLEKPELYLQQTLDQLAEMDRFVPRMTGAWKAGDQQALYDLVFREGIDEHPEFEQLHELLFYRRNREMAKKIQDFSQQHQTLFVIVGAGHLVGDRSVTDLLKGVGFHITQI
ncbi:TraB/GumN family protein [Microbulbifer sp. SH-1]|uniref:TraB/GumN family protein n=1 Tax=Microbulbifer sp. SH-1 TaxID=2681547 RepID=UPI00140A4929|nr:TraB/GumN family protein [Microbulbifer sp. SH-1]QIL88923.1 TraB/GumN family protein [Microbulbifer sp. SH-1]